jgi:hypothetical protein
MPDPGAEVPAPFRIEFDQATGQVVLWTTSGLRPRQTVRRTELASLEALTVKVAEHLHDSRVHQHLAEGLVQAAVDHLGADPVRLYAAAAELQDPSSTVPLGEMLNGTPARGTR